MKTLYKERSDFVHGRKHGGITLALVDELEEICRKAIMKAISFFDSEIGVTPAASFEEVKSKLLSELKEAEIHQ